MMNDATISIKTGIGCWRMPASISARNETSSSFFHDTTASQSKKRHQITAPVSRISCSVCRIPERRTAVPRWPVSPPAAELPWFVSMSLPSEHVVRRDYAGASWRSSAARRAARRREWNAENSASPQAGRGGPPAIRGRTRRAGPPRRASGGITGRARASPGRIADCRDAPGTRVRTNHVGSACAADATRPTELARCSSPRCMPAC